jgi:hypothetical protein
MGPYSFTDRVRDWFAYLPIALAYRLVWLAVLTGNVHARDVYRAMWHANLDLPPIPSLTEGTNDGL